MKILAGLLTPDKGEVEVCGLPPREAENRLGYLPEDALPFLNLTVRENLEYVTLLRGVRDYKERIKELVEALGLTDLDRPAGALSRGNRQRLAWPWP